ncbi:unnamed protein product [Closterium sp. NIES-54]
MSRESSYGGVTEKSLVAMFDGCTCLEDLYLYCSEHAAIPPSIDRLSRLTNLTLRERVTRLPDTLTSLQSLRSLMLKTSMLEALPQDFGNLLAALNRLSLRHCSALQLPASFTALSSLTILEARRCDILPPSLVDFGRLRALETLILVVVTGMRDLIVALEHLQRVKTLIIKHCSDITSLPVSLPRLPALTDLTLDIPQPSVLPDDFGQLSELRTLVLEGSLTALPDSIALVTTLQELSLNLLVNLTCLPHEFGQLVALKKLCLNDLQRLTHLPETFGQLTALWELKFLECRKLQRLPDTVSQLSSLEHLEINVCPRLTALPDDMGKGLHSLRHLLLLHCLALTHLPPSFSGLTSLETFKILHAESFKGTLLDGFGRLKSLKELSLRTAAAVITVAAAAVAAAAAKRSFLRIKELNVNSFGPSLSLMSSLTQLKLLNMYRLESLPDSISHLSHLQSLRINSAVGLKALPRTLGRLSGLRVLQLVRLITMRQLPESLRQLKMLETLDIVDCFKLMQLPWSFTNLTKLRSCTLVKLGISAFPDGICSLSSLQKLLILGLKQLGSLPDSFTRLPKLEDLQVSFCKKLAQVPPSLRRMPTLREYYVSDCPLLSERVMRRVPARREEDKEAEEGEGEEDWEGGDTEEQEWDGGGYAAAEREMAGWGWEAMAEEESGGDDGDVEHEYEFDSDYDRDDDDGGWWGERDHD